MLSFRIDGWASLKISPCLSPFTKLWLQFKRPRNFCVAYELFSKLFHTKKSNSWPRLRPKSIRSSRKELWILLSNPCSIKLTWRHLTSVTGMGFSVRQARLEFCLSGDLGMNYLTFMTWKWMFAILNMTLLIPTLITVIYLISLMRSDLPEQKIIIQQLYVLHKQVV